MTPELKNTLGGAFARINAILSIAKIEMAFMKQQCKNQQLNYELGMGIKAVDKCIRQSNLILGDKAKQAMDNQLEDERLFALSRIFQLISHLDTKSLEFIETQFEEALKQQP